jgi:maleamate amidohydrolase
MTSSLDKNYAKAYGHSLTPGTKPALILQAYFDPDCELYAGVDDALQSALRILQVAREKELLIVYTNVVYQAGGVDGGRFFEKALPLKHFVRGSPMGAWAAGLEWNREKTSLWFPSNMQAHSSALLWHRR